MKRVQVFVTPKKGVLDPQGKAIESGLKLNGFDSIGSVRLGKFIELEIADPTESKLKEICEKLLANTVIEDFRFEILDS